MVVVMLVIMKRKNKMNDEEIIKNIGNKLNELVADWFCNNEVMTSEDYDNLMLQSEEIV